MASRYPAPVAISEHVRRNGNPEIVLEPIDQVAAVAQAMREDLDRIVTESLAARERLGKLMAAIETERERQTLSPLLTTSEVAKYLQVDEDTVRSLKQRGKLKAVQVGSNSPRFRACDVAAFVESVSVERGR